MIITARIILILFGLFLIGVGLLMLFDPKRARAYIGQAGSTNFINYFEITIRMIPAAALVIYADFSKYPEAFKILGWFMLGTSLVLYFVPRRMHHAYALWCARMLKPFYIRLMAPFSVIFGCLVLYTLS